MHYISTREQAGRVSLAEAITQGLANDGGLFLPETFPQVNLAEFDAALSYPDFAYQLLKPYFADDVLKAGLKQFCHDAFHFPIPLQTLNNNTYLLELFHGPTSSFKDFGARFLAEALSALSQKKKTTIMVATSGDTGSAVASAFYNKAMLDVVILYPENQITERQEKQITCWDNNVLALAVKGTFDDCQHLVKSAFKESHWQKERNLSSANSINIGRLLPQIVYYAYTSLHFYHQHQVMPGFIVPTGNLGNATAGYIAKLMGFPIREIALSTNANHVISDYLNSGEFHPRPSIQTLANAMDVGNPSNFERLRFIFDSFAEFKRNVRAQSVSDALISETISKIYRQYGVIVCPHTATACCMRESLSDEPWIVVATADPSKFSQVIEPIIGREIAVSEQLRGLLARPQQIRVVENSLGAVEKEMLRYWGY